MAYKNVEPEKGIPVAVTKKGSGKFTPGTHKCRVVSVVKTPDDTSIALFHHTLGLHTETLISGWPESLERGDEITVFVGLTPGVIAERHPALQQWRLLDALTKEVVREYNEDVSALCKGQTLAAPVLEEVTYNNRVYKLEALVRVGA